MTLMSFVLLVATCLLGSRYVSASDTLKDSGNQGKGTQVQVWEVQAQEAKEQGSKAPVTLESLEQPHPEESAAGPENVQKEDEAQTPEAYMPEEHNPRVAIDAGHGGVDDGCCRDGVTEDDINMQIARRLAAKLEAMGFETVLIREDEETRMSLQDRVDKAKDADADIYVSIHQNSYGETDNEVKGIETWYNKASEDSRRLARLVHKYAVEKTGAKGRDVRETEELVVVCEASMPSCLIETGFLSNRGEREALLKESYQEKLADGIAQGIDYYFNPKTMYLTFDDGPSEENTAAILDILKERGIQATFFVVGQSVRRYPEVAQRIVAEGHTIAIHCNSHEYGEVYASADSYIEDFWEAYEAVYEVTGVEAQLFRFPGGSINSFNGGVYEEIVERMTEEGFIYYDWNASLEDAVKRADPEQLLENGVSSALSRKRVVMLAHDVVYATTLCLEDLLDALPEYRMEPLTAEVEPIQFAPKKD